MAIPGLALIRELTKCFLIALIIAGVLSASTAGFVVIFVKFPPDLENAVKYWTFGGSFLVTFLLVLYWKFVKGRGPGHAKGSDQS